ncbi:MAG: ATP-grasp domain-containing protein [Nitrososphaerales archaeon]
MKVAIFEYASGGGLQGRPIPHNILCEGYSMLKTATEDFQSAGYTVTSLLDSRSPLLQSHLNADEVVKVSPTYSVQRALNDTLKSSDLSLIIAPETDGILSSLVRMGRSSTASLNSTPDSIDLVSDKAKLAAALHRNGFSTPETRCLSIEEGVGEAERVAEELLGRVIVKPVDGVGCEDLSIVKDAAQMRQAVKKILRGGQMERFMIQKFVEGLPASVSLISNGVEVRPVSLNLQQLSLNPPPEPSCYLGGVVPLLHPDMEEAFGVAKRAVELFRGLRGYVGVDMVLSSSGPLILEINPRLTVSYVGLKRVSKVNLAEAMVKSALGEELPISFELEGVSVFSKIRSEAAEDIRNDVEILCPRLQVEGEELAYTFVAAKGRTESEAKRLFTDAVLLHGITGKAG